MCTIAAKRMASQKGGKINGKETVSRSIIIINEQDVESCSQRHAARGLQHTCGARLRQGGVRRQARQPAGRHAALQPSVRRAVLHHRGQHVRLHAKTVMCVPFFNAWREAG